MTRNLLRIKANEQGNRKFNFLKEGDPYHAYYLHKVKDFIEGKAQEPAVPQLPVIPATAKQAAAAVSCCNQGGSHPQAWHVVISIPCTSLV